MCVANLPSPCPRTVPCSKCTILKMLLFEIRVGLSEVRFPFPHVGDDGVFPQGGSESQGPGDDAKGTDPRFIIPTPAHLNNLR